ncbi:MAG: 2-dehydro-3-deoxygalactonokinase [Erythrobacter sp.]|uniref:2-dehydro-3-deoxygalactonokinase n=1 Tax=Erythrobacter sp. TaxID=1042 RepID=UPI0025F8DB36|nr:2-dehydro-3-deoxygalactonokinase [Erythrobacter sp.]MCL9998922.1 2-dehydro-3-deoxygalactonokinase [Erythrobacter sp.]
MIGSLIGKGPFIAVDWGTTNRRAWRVGPDGVAEAECEDACGITALAPGDFAGQVAMLRETLGDLPMLLGGMIGSNRGWRETPYVACPADARAIAEAIMWIDPQTGIIPGVAQERRDAPDVMRGEEVQIIGALASGLVPENATLCLPGTHAKWVRLCGGRIAGFSTWMTGELFALLGEHSILAPQMEGKARAGAGFAAGVVASAECDPLGHLFAVRAAHLLAAPMIDGPGYVSGLLIGAEVRAGLRTSGGEVPHLIGRPDLNKLYAAAIAQVQGNPAASPPAMDGNAAFRAGCSALLREFA